MALRLGRWAESAWDRFVSFCADFSVLFRILSAFLVFFSGGLASYLLFQGHGFLSIASAFGIAALLETVREKVGDELVSGRTTASRRRDARRLLKIAGDALIPAGLADEFEPETKRLRANVMQHDEFSGKLCIWESFNMDGDEDRELEIDDHSGVAGHVYQRCRNPCAFDRIENPNDPRADVAPIQANHSVRDELRSVLSVPIYHPYARNQRPGPDEKIGVLNIDSDLPVERVGWDDPDIQDFAVTVADLLAVTLEQ